MNVIHGIVEDVVVHENLSLVKIRAGHNLFSSIIIDTPSTVEYLKYGHSIDLVFKETEVIISTLKQPKISLQNQIEGRISKIESGKILSKVILETSAGTIASIITTNAVNELDLKNDDQVVAMIKTNEIMLSL